MTGSVEVRIIFLQSKMAKTSRRRLQSGCVFNSQERKERINQTFAERTGEWRARKTMITGLGFQDLKWKHWPESFCRKSKGFMKAQKGRRPLNTGRLNKTPKTPKTNKTSSGGTRIGRIRSRRFLCVRIQLFIQKEKSERISHLEDTVRIILFWSECNYRIWRSPVKSMVCRQSARGFIRQSKHRTGHYSILGAESRSSQMFVSSCTRI